MPDEIAPASNRAPDPALRLYALIRADLSMPMGKAASQAAHAFFAAFLSCSRSDPERVSSYGDPGPSFGTKICLLAPNEQAVQRALSEATEAGLPCGVVTDSGHLMPPHFDGEPIVTAAGFGPVSREEVRRILGRFPLA